MTRLSLLSVFVVTTCLAITSTTQAALIFQMDFNDADGNSSLLDRGTTGVTGTFTGGSTFSSAVAPSNSGGFSGSFDGANGAADFGDIDAVDGLSALTITAWVQASTPNSGGTVGSDRIVSDRELDTPAAHNGFDLYYHDTDSELEFAGDGQVRNGGGSFPGQVWTWIAVTYDGSTATFYTGDGTTVSAGDTATLSEGTLAGNDAPLLIGNFVSGLRTYTGLIDNVRIYDSVENPASLLSIMQFNDAPATVPEPGSLPPMVLGGVVAALGCGRHMRRLLLG